MVQEIIPRRNPFFAGPQPRTQPRPVPPIQQIQRSTPILQEQQKTEETKEGFFKRNKKIFIIAGITCLVIVVGYLVFSWLGLFADGIQAKA